MSLEIMLLAVNINFVAFSYYLSDLVGQIFAIFVLTVAGAEAAIGLAILVIYYKNKQNIEVEGVSIMNGWYMLKSSHFQLRSLFKSLQKLKILGILIFHRKLCLQLIH